MEYMVKDYLAGMDAEIFADLLSQEAEDGWRVVTMAPFNKSGVEHMKVVFSHPAGESK